MNWNSCIHTFAHRGWIILFMVVLAITVTFVQSAAQKPVYRAVQRILLQPAPTSSTPAQFIKYSPDTYTSWLSSLSHASQVIDTLELDMAPHELQSTVSIDLNAEKALLDITVEMEDAAAAELIASTYGSNFVRWLNQQNQSLQGVDHVHAMLWDYPELTTKETFTAGGMALDALIGALVGIALVFSRPIFDRIAGQIRSHPRNQFVH